MHPLLHPTNTHPNPPRTCTNPLNSLFPNDRLPGGPPDPRLALVVVVSIQPVSFLTKEEGLVLFLHFGDLLEFLF